MRSVTRPDLDQALSDGRELTLGKRARAGHRGAHASISQNAAVWMTASVPLTFPSKPPAYEKILEKNH